MEVLLAIGIFLVTIMALVGLLGPTLKSVEEVEKTDEVSSVVDTLNAFLQKSPDIATEDGDGNKVSKFEAIYNAVGTDDHATVFVFRKYRDNNSEDVEIRVGFSENDEGSVNGDAVINEDDNEDDNEDEFSYAAGPIYRAVLSASSAIPEDYRSESRAPDSDVYELAQDVDSYPEGYFAMEVRIFAEDPPGPDGEFETDADLSDLADKDPIFTYNTAIVR